MTLVIGVDPHKQTHTAVAAKAGSGELVDDLCAAAQASGYAHLLTWALAIDAERVWALETCAASVADLSASCSSTVNMWCVSPRS